MSNPTAGIAELSAAAPAMASDPEQSLTTLLDELQFRYNRRESLCNEILAKVAVGKDMTDMSFEDLCQEMRTHYEKLTEEEKKNANPGEVAMRLEKRALEVETKLRGLEIDNTGKLAQVTELLDSIKELGAQIDNHDEQNATVLLEKELALLEAANTEAHLRSDLETSKLESIEETQALSAEVSALKQQMADFALKTSVVHREDKELVQEYQKKLECEVAANRKLWTSIYGAELNLANHFDMVRKLKSEVSQLQEEVSKRDEIIHKTNSAIQAGDKVMAKVLREHKEELAAKESEVASVKVEISEKEEALQAELNSVRTDLSSLSETLDVKTDAAHDLNMEQIRLRGLTDSLNDTVKLKEATITELGKSLQDQTLVVSEQSDQIDYLLNDLGHTAAVIQSQEHELDRLNKVIDAKNLEVEALKWRAGVLNASLDDAEGRVLDLRGDLDVATSERSNLLQRLTQRIVKLEADIDRGLECVQEKNAEMVWLHKQLVNETGIEVTEGEEIKFIASHFGHTINAKAMINDEDFGGYASGDEDFNAVEGSEPEQLTIPFVLNDGELRRFATKEEMQGNIDPQLVELQSPLVQDYFHDLWKTASEDPLDEETVGVEAEAADLIEAVKEFYGEGEFKAEKPLLQMDEDQVRQIIEAKSLGAVKKDCVDVAIKDNAIVGAATEKALVVDDTLGDWDVVSALSGEGE